MFYPFMHKTSQLSRLSIVRYSLKQAISLKTYSLVISSLSLINKFSGYIFSFRSFQDAVKMSHPVIYRNEPGCVGDISKALFLTLLIPSTATFLHNYFSACSSLLFPGYPRLKLSTVLSCFLHPIHKGSFTQRGFETCILGRHLCFCRNRKILHRIWQDQTCAKKLEK